MHADFEGEIPEGEYGAGRVIVWDSGDYENLTRGRFSDPAWIRERKFDGERCLAFADGERLRTGPGSYVTPGSSGCGGTGIPPMRHGRRHSEQRS